MSLRKTVMTSLIGALALSILAPAAYGKREAPQTPTNLAAGLSYSVSAPPSATYPDAGNELTDGSYAATVLSSPGWQGHLRGMSRTVSFDLQQLKSVSEVKANFLQNNGSAVYFPMKVTVSVSKDGTEWGTLAEIESRIPTHDPAKRTQAYAWNGAVDGLPRGNPHADMVLARYVNVTFTTDDWVFLDEIEIWGVDGRAPSAKTLPPDEPAAPEQPGYLQPGEATAGIRSLALLYNGWNASGFGNWTKPSIMPYLGYENASGETVDLLFDGVLFLGLNAPSTRSFAESGTPSNKEDWQWYLDKTFAPDGDLSQLNEAAVEVGTRLGNPSHKAKAVLMIPYPSFKQSDFGDVDGDGATENMNQTQIGYDAAYENRRKAIRWYVGEAIWRWNDAAYSNLEFGGLYWLSEKVNLSAAYEEELIAYTGGLVREGGGRFFWIPTFEGTRFWRWKELGFDAVAMQPNHFFTPSIPDSRIEAAAGYGKRYGIGIELETNERMLRPGAPASDGDSWRRRYTAYLNGGVEYGYMTGAFRAYYQGAEAYLKGARSALPEARATYDWTYRFVKGTYTKQ
ncbi:DUF4855 domain-containing protein [Paenibacillus flagellatus]|uniref:DUF4855 domain-containing protein n=1 Tax=Paenibacillus flagellatus TaxID=2211139 RepID=UPI0013052F74|nr:DUF4855 domain-containing protein [Paenibacillus flagellatus]